MPELRSMLFDRQQQVWDDDSPTKAILGSRRNGKSVYGCAWLLDGARKLNRPGFLFPYIAQSRKNAKLIAWEELKRIIREAKMSARLNESDLSARLDNGNTVILGGCNDRSEVERWRGLKCGRAFLDECGAMPYLHDLVETVRPSLMDVAGPMTLAGTPGLVWKGLWYELTGPGRTSEVPLYQWTLFDNPCIPAAHEEAYRYKRERGWADDDPTWLREYLGQWSYDPEGVMFPWQTQDSAEELPQMYHSPWRYVLGVDVGVVDESAFVLWACHVNDPRDFVVESRKRSGLLTGQVAQICKGYVTKYSCPVVMDTGGMGKAHAAELASRHSIGVVPAEKREKESAIRVLRDRIRAHGVSVLTGQQNDAIRDEWAVLQWNDDKTDFAEGQSDHASHAALYGHRFMRNYLYKPPQPVIAPGSPEHAKQTEDRILQAQQRRYKRNGRPQWDR